MVEVLTRDQQANQSLMAILTRLQERGLKLDLEHDSHNHCKLVHHETREVYCRYLYSEMLLFVKGIELTWRFSDLTPERGW